MNFSSALECVKEGALIQRAGWNGKKMFVFYVKGSNFAASREPLSTIFPAGTEINYRAHLDIRTADGTIVPWVASQTDILANDWQLYK